MFSFNFNNYIILFVNDLLIFKLSLKIIKVLFYELIYKNLLVLNEKNNI